MLSKISGNVCLSIYKNNDKLNLWTFGTAMRFMFFLTNFIQNSVFKNYRDTGGITFPFKSSSSIQSLISYNFVTA